MVPTEEAMREFLKRQRDYEARLEALARQQDAEQAARRGGK